MHFKEYNKQYKKLSFSYRRGTARRAVSVETVRNVAQMFIKLHLKSLATGKQLSRSFKVIEMARIHRPYDTSY